MPPDRIITILIAAPGSVVDGDYRPGAITEHRVWATRHDLSLEDLVEQGGNRTETRRRWRIRWFRALAEVEELSFVSVLDDGLTFGALNVVEVTGSEGTTRRRWQDIEGILST